MPAKLRARYGAGPLHLLAVLASLLVAGAGVIGWCDSFATSDIIRILVWFFAAIVAHDLILLPLYALLDRVALSGSGSRTDTPPARSPGWVYVRIPALLSGLLLIVFFPEILRSGDGTFHTASGLHQNVYLVRFLISCAVLFAGSGAAFVLSRARSR